MTFLQHAKQYNSLNMNQQTHQQASMTYAQPRQQNNLVQVSQPQGYAQPAVTPAPAREYYQNLVSQGYPHEHAVAYTQQYFPGFNG